MELCVGQADANSELALLDLFLTEQFAQFVNCNRGVWPPYIELVDPSFQRPIKLKLHTVGSSQPVDLVLGQLGWALRASQDVVESLSILYLPFDQFERLLI